MTGSPPRLSRAGFTTTVITPWGRETYQVWLEQGTSSWIARIMTLPNRIWARPGGREAVKFFGATAEEAEAAAASFIEQERLATRRRVASPNKDAPRTHPGASIHSPPSPPPQAAPRITRRLLLRFGPHRPDRPGLTANLSESGLFIITDRPCVIGAEVEIDLRFPDIPIMLGGEIVWISDRRESGRSVGFGVKLVKRPAEYVTRVKTLSLVSDR